MFNLRYSMSIVHIASDPEPSLLMLESECSQKMPDSTGYESLMTTIQNIKPLIQSFAKILWKERFELESIKNLKYVYLKYLFLIRY